MSERAFTANDQFSPLFKQMWWLVLIRGILAVLFGVVALVWPGITVWALVVVFGIYAIVDGVVLVYHSIRDRARLDGWGWWLAMGLVSIAAGIVALVWPAATALVVLYIIAFYAILFGVTGIIGALSFRKVPNSGWGWSLFAGILAVLLGVVLLIFPGSGIISLIWLLGIYAILFGVLLIVVAFQVRKVAKEAGLV
ncbi:HdeD family acid-resistance protein [Rhodococcus sp. GXMU-t2271]|uniref:HdeD family acid-resistance protein n=1 Tax=Rhodococcus indonesiensis TaxID=3055869 RepID=A0ABT7RJM0_9NOCA|nr:MULTISPECIES: HdeD family acid-resistance protein [Rhodococcus]MDM7487836.1 HdeD family acid-resistance protein [Rhodococcus indonesiensis]